MLQKLKRRHIAQMMTYSAVGTPREVEEHLDRFTEHADADELMVVHQAMTGEARLRSLELLAEVHPAPAESTRTGM